MELGFQSSETMAARSAALKRDGSGFSAGDDWRPSKLSNGNFSPPPLKPSSPDANMLSFSSSSKPETSSLPYFHQIPAAYTKNSGCYSSAVNLVNGVKGPFTPSQWLELEQQALIYKYITANTPIPAHLILPISKALESAGLLAFNGGTLRPTTWGWGPFHLGYSGSTDPEPGRCRRTDGKKWRCSRDAVADHKYCERHMNRGRHRSRKHVEACGDAAAKSTATVPSSPAAALAAPIGGSSNSFDLTLRYHQAKNLQQPATNPLLNRMNVNRQSSSQGLQNNATQLSFLPSINLNSNESSFSVPKHQDTYGFLSSYARSESEQQHSLYPFIDEWPKSQPDHSGIVWPGLQPQTQSESTQPSMGSADSASRELEMGLGVGTAVSWGPSMGGPLGEVLHNSSNGHCFGEGRKAPALNLLPTVWESSGGYQQSTSSPTGVLQRSALVSLSNSSAGSSPRADNSKTIESGASLCNDQLGSTALAHSSLPGSD